MSMDTLAFLVEMRKELKDDNLRLENKLDEDNKALTQKLDATLTVLHSHETRLVIVEGTRKDMRWLGGTILLGFIGGLFDFFFNHVHHVGR